MSRLCLALAAPLILSSFGCALDQDDDTVEFRNKNKDGNLKIHTPPAAGDDDDDPDCLIWEIKDSGASEDSDGVYLNTLSDGEITDADGTVLCEVDADEGELRDMDGNLLLVLDGNRIEDGAGNTLWSIAADTIFAGPVSDHDVFGIGDANIAKSTKARKLQIGSLLEDVDACISGRVSEPPTGGDGGDDGRTDP